MQKSSTRFLILGIIVMAIIAIVASYFIVNFSNSISENDVEITNTSSLTANNFTAGTTAISVSAAQQNEIGTVNNFNAGTGTAVTQSNYTTAFGTGSISTNYKLTEDISFTTKNVKIDSTTNSSGRSRYTGVFDGQGHVITISSGSFSQDGVDNAAHGILWGGLYGTIKNVTIIVQNFSVDMNNKSELGLGVICGIASGATFQNVKIVYRNSQSNFYQADVTKNNEMTSGLFAAKVVSKCAFTNCEVNLQSEYRCYHYPKNDIYASMGAFVGWVAGGTGNNATTMTNIVLSGSGDIKFECRNSWYAYLRMGSIIGQAKGGAVAIDGLTYKWTGGFNQYNCGNVSGSYVGQIYGYTNQSVTAVNVYKTDSATYPNIPYNNLGSTTHNDLHPAASAYTVSGTSLADTHASAYGFEDGQVGGNSLTAATNSTSYITARDYANKGWTAISSGDELYYALRTRNRTDAPCKYYLTQDIVWSNRTWDYSNDFAEEIDGCGHSITISSCSDTHGSKSSVYFGILTSGLSGVIKNVSITINSAQLTASQNEKSGVRVGLFGYVSGVLENVTVDYKNTQQIYYCNDSDKDQNYICVGVIAGVTRNATLKNVTVKANANLSTHLGQLEWTGHNGDVNICIAYCVGLQESGTANFTNLTITGSGTITGTNKSDTWSTWYGGEDGKQTYGVILGRNNGTVNITGLIYDFTGTIASTVHTTIPASYGAIVGGGTDPSTWTQIFYTNSQDNYAKQNGVKSNGDTNNTPSTTKDYASSLISTTNAVFAKRIGLIGTNIWIGQLSNPTNTNSRTITGNFVDTITIGSTPINVSSLASVSNYVPYVALASLDGSIDGYTFLGQYAFVEDESSAMSGSINSENVGFGKDTSSANANAFKATMPDYAITGITTTNAVYRGNSKITGFTRTVDSWTPNINSPALTTYHLTSSKVGSEVTNNNNIDYCVVYGGTNYYSAYLRLTLELTDSTEDVEVIYDGQPHTITLNITGFKQAYGTWNQVPKTIKYYNTNTSAYDLDAAPTFTNYPGGTVSYQITFGAYNNNTYPAVEGTKTVTIEKAPIKVLFDDTKELYDSILDTTTLQNGTKCYDFIYVANQSEYSKIGNINYFASNYYSNFKGIVPVGQTATENNCVNSTVTASNGNIIVNNILKITPNTQTGVLSYSWYDANNDGNPDWANAANYDLTQISIATTGSGLAEDAAFTYCDAAYNTTANTYLDCSVRLVIVSPVIATFNGDYAYAGNQTSSAITGSNGTGKYDGGGDLANSYLYKTLTYHYYDNVGLAELNQVTEIKISGTWYIDTLYTGAAIIPSYKTLNGGCADHTSGGTGNIQGEIYYKKEYKNGNNKTYWDDISNVTFNIGNSSNTGTTTASTTGTPAYLSVLNTTYYGAGILAGINYGVIKGFNFDFYKYTNNGVNPYLVIKGYTNANTALGTVVGINCGLIKDNGFWYTRDFKYQAQSASYNFATGQIAGINTGTITDNIDYTYHSLLYSDHGVDRDQYAAFRFDVLGNALNCYYGFIAGINTGVASSMTMNDGSDHNRNKLPIYIKGNWNLYAGGFVGYNAGSISDLDYELNKVYAKYDSISQTGPENAYEGGGSSLCYGYELYFVSDNGVVYGGGLCGYNTGSITDSDFTVKANAVFTISAAGNEYAGGILGYNEGSVTNSDFINGATVNIISAGNKYVGGSVGYNKGSINSCEVTNNSSFTVSDTATTTQKSTIIGGLVGYNKGTAQNSASIQFSTVYNNSTILYSQPTSIASSYNGSVILSGGVGVNDQYASIHGLTVNQEGVIQVGTTFVGANNNDTNTYAAADPTNGNVLEVVTVGGLIGINAGGAANYLVINGGGDFAINSQKYTVDSEGVRSYTSKTQLAINYLHFAVGIGISNNSASSPNYMHPNVTVHQSVDGSGNNSVSNIIINYLGETDFYATHYMAGLAFAKAAQNATSTEALAYKGIIWNNEYHDMSLYTLSDSYGGLVVNEGTSSSSGLSLMGWVDGVSSGATFVSGAQIDANVSSMSIYWEKVNNDYTGKLVFETPETDFVPANRIQSFNLLYYATQAVRLDMKVAPNNTYYTTSYSSTTKFTFDSAFISTGLINDVTSGSNASSALQLLITFNYPEVIIYDIYQLVQFLWFDASDENNIANYYLNEYYTQIDKATDKAATTSKYGAWANASDANINSIKAMYDAKEMKQIGNKWYFMEKYYDSTNDLQIYYYRAKKARIANDLVLNKYVSNTVNTSVDFGFEKTTWKEFAEDKVLNGSLLDDNSDNVTITLPVKDYVDAAKNSVSTTSKWYQNSDTWLSEVDLGDDYSYDTPSQDNESMIFGGFVGVNKGTIKNINFVFPEGTVLNISSRSDTLGELEVADHFYIGLISAINFGTIDNCSLTLEDDTQLYAYKAISAGYAGWFGGNDDVSDGVFMGGFAGLLGKGATISNSTLTFGENAKIGAQGKGTSTNLGVRGNLFMAIGGMVGQMLGSSRMYNLKIEGDETSRVFTMMDSTKYNAAATAAGGLVGVNTTNDRYTKFNLGMGTIDGVIFNWNGVSISFDWSDGWFGSSVGGDREKLNFYYTKGNILGVTGTKSNDLWYNNNVIRNLYYTFDLADFKFDDNFTPPTQITLYTNNSGGTATKNLGNAGSDKNKYYKNSAVSVSDILSIAQNASFAGLLANDVKVLAIYKLPYTANVSGTGVNPTNPTNTRAVYNAHSEIIAYVTDYDSISADQAYQKITQVGDLLSWTDKTTSAHVFCHFVATGESVSNIIWQITIDDAVITAGNFLQDPEENHNSMTEIPVYRFAESLSDTVAYKTMDYTIRRGSGNGMKLYYCMGDAAILVPNETLYTNQATAGANVYNAMKAIMYDGASTPAGSSISIYATNGTQKYAITRPLAVSKESIVANSDYVETIIQKSDRLGDWQYVSDQPNVGNYNIVYNIKATEDLNTNACIVAADRIAFFNSEDAPSVQISGGTKYYVRNNAVYTEVILYESEAFTYYTEETDLYYITGGTGTNQDPYTYAQVGEEDPYVGGTTYFVNTGTEQSPVFESVGGLSEAEFGYYRAETKLYEDNQGTEADSYSSTLFRRVEQYSVFAVVAPIPIALNTAEKVFDMEATFGNDTHFSATIVNDGFTYSPTGLSTSTEFTSGFNGNLAISNVISIAPDGNFDSAAVGDPKTATFRMDGSFTYTIYQYESSAWHAKTITVYILKDKNGKQVFSIASLTTRRSQVEDNGYYYDTYGNSSATINTTTLTGSSTYNQLPIVRIIRNTITSIVLEDCVLEHTFDGTSYNCVDDSIKATLIDHLVITTNIGTFHGDDEGFDDMFAASYFTFTQETADRTNVELSGYIVNINVAYAGGSFANRPTNATTLTLYIIPVAITVTRAVKDYDATNSLSGATVVLNGGSNLPGNVSQASVYSSFSGTFSSADVGNTLNVTFATTSGTESGKVKSISINGTPYNILIGSANASPVYNYYVQANYGSSKGIINPIAARINSVIKDYDGTTAVGTSEFDIEGLNPANHNAYIALNYTLLGTYNAAAAGSRTFTTTLVAFDKVTNAVSNAKATVYRLKNGNNLTNYYIDGASSTSYAASASIIPIYASITSITKTYDGGATFTNTTQVIGDLLSGDSSLTFDGAFDATNVGICDVILTTASLGQLLDGNTYVVLVSGENNTGYCLDTTDADVSQSSNSYTVTDKGAIVPKLATITEISKYYDGTNNLSTTYIKNDGFNNTVVNITDGSSPISDDFEGTFAQVNATNSCSVTITTVDFVDLNGTHYKRLNSTSNYCLGQGTGNATIASVGKILKLDINVDGNSTSGSISNIRFSTSSSGTGVNGGYVYVNASHYSSNTTSVREVIYLANQTYSIANFKADLKIGNQTKTITGSASEATVEIATGITLTFTLTGSYTNYGIHEFTLALSGEASANYQVGTTGTNNKFWLGIDSQRITDATKIKVYMTNLSRVYTASDSYSPSLTASSSWTITTPEGDVANGSKSNASVSADFSGCTDVRTYTANNGTYQFTISQTMKWVSSESNYYFDGTTTEIYSSSNHSNRMTYEITRATLTDNSSNCEATYNGSAHGIIVSFSGILESDSISYTYSEAQSGSYTSTPITEINYTEAAVTVYYRLSGSKISNYKVGSTNAESYIGSKTITINQRALNVDDITELTKDFDGSSTYTFAFTTDIEEEVELTLDLGKVLPGTYGNGDDPQITASITVNDTNYTVNKDATLTLTINKAKIVVERQYVSAGTFKLAFAITNLTSYTFINGIAAALDWANATNVQKAALIASLNSLFFLSCNDSVGMDFTASMISSISTKTTGDYLALEFLLVGEDTLDNLTITDRYTIYMYSMSYDSENEVYAIDEAVPGSNIATSSSELSDGQFDTYHNNEGYTAVNTLAGLLTALEAGNNIYLTGNIYGYDATALTATSYSGTLYGNGYTIELVGGLNTSSTVSGAFIATNTGTIKDVNFKYLSNIELDNETATDYIGLVIGSNSGIIENVSLDIGDVAIGENMAAKLGGIVGSNTNGELTNVTVVYSTNITYSNFGGIAHTISAGTISFVAARSMNSCTAIAGYAIAHTATSISYVINAIHVNNVNLVSSGTLSNKYGESTTAIEFFDQSSYSDAGYLDYYFTKRTKFLTSSVGHNEFNENNVSNENTSYYYGYSNVSSIDTQIVALEAIAPLNRFIWEAFDAYAYGTSFAAYLNRAVGLFTLATDITNVDLDGQGGANAGALIHTQDATIFTPVIGGKVTTVIAPDVDTIQVKEYDNGNPVTATFNTTEQGVTVKITGTNVGMYTEYYTEASYEQAHEATQQSWDATTFSVKLVTADSATGDQAIMLIIIPKQLTDSATITKQYDTTSIAETVINGKNVFAKGKYYDVEDEVESEVSIVGDDYIVKYNSETKGVAAVYDNGTYKFVTFYKSGYNEVTRKEIYTIKYIKIGNSAFTSQTNVNNVQNAESVVAAYYQLKTLTEVNNLKTRATQNQIEITYNGLTSETTITTAYVYDLTFSIDVQNDVTTYGATRYYATSLYTTADANVRSTNYAYLISSNNNQFTSNSIYHGTSSTIREYTYSNNGSITNRVIAGTYSNLNQSYRGNAQGNLSDITLTINSIENNAQLTNIPYTMSTAQKDALRQYINTNIVSATPTTPILNALYTAGYVNRAGAQGNYTYSAKHNYYEEIPVAASNSIDIAGTYLTVTAPAATLKLRYYAYHGYDETLHADVYEIDTFEGLLAIDKTTQQENGGVAGTYTANDYLSLNYIIVNNLNGKGAVVSTFTNTFAGTIDGNDKIVRNFALLGTTSTSLFGELAETANIHDLTFMNVYAVATTNSAATMGVVSNLNRGTLDNIQVYATYVTNGTATVSTIANTNANTGNITNAYGVVDTIHNLTVDSNVVAGERANTVILYRVYGLEGSVTFRLTTSATSTFGSLSSTHKAIISNNVMNAPISLTKTAGVLTGATVNNFREYWAWFNLFKFVGSYSINGYIVS